MVVAVNNQKEVCTLHLSCGGLMLTKDDFLSHVHKASTICSENLIVKIKDKLKANEELQKGQTLQKQLESKMRIDHEKPIAPVNEDVTGNSKTKGKSKTTAKTKKKNPRNLSSERTSNEQMGDESGSGKYKIEKKRRDVSALVENNYNWRIGQHVTSELNLTEGFESVIDEADRTDNFGDQKMTLPSNSDVNDDDDDESSDEEESVQVIL